MAEFERVPGSPGSINRASGEIVFRYREKGTTVEVEGKAKGTTTVELLANWFRAAREVASGDDEIVAAAQVEAAMARMAMTDLKAEVGRNLGVTTGFTNEVKRGQGVYEQIVAGARVDVAQLVAVAGLAQVDLQALRARVNWAGGMRTGAQPAVRVELNGVAAYLESLVVGGSTGRTAETSAAAAGQQNPFTGLTRFLVGAQLGVLEERVARGNIGLPLEWEQYSPLKELGMGGVEGGLTSGTSGMQDLLRSLGGSRGELQGHGLEHYREAGETRGVFDGDLPGRGLLAVLGDPIVEFSTVSGGFRVRHKYDLLIELNRFIQGKGNQGEFEGILMALKMTGGERFMLKNVTMALTAVWGLDESGNYADLASEKGGLLEKVDPRGIGLLAGRCPEFVKLFKHYWEKFDRGLFRTSSMGRLTQADNGEVWKEKDLLNEDRTVAQRLGCSVGLATLARHFVSDYGVFPQTFPEMRRILNRYPRLFLVIQKDVPSVLLAGGGFKLADIGGSRTVLMRKLEKCRTESEYREVLKIFSDLSTEGNRDPKWALKVWGIFHGIFVALDAFKNTIKSVGLDPRRSFGEWIQNSPASVFDALVKAKFFAYGNNGEISLPWMDKLLSGEEGTKPLREAAAKVMVRYLFGLKPAERSGSAAGSLMPVKGHQWFGNVAQEIVANILPKCRVVQRDGVAGGVVDRDHPVVHPVDDENDWDDGSWE